MDNKQFVVVDIETTWLSRERSRITEIAAMRYNGTEIIDRYETLVNPEKPISYSITRLTGIDDELVKDAPIISEVLPWFFDFMKDDIMVAHNASFDYGFLNYNAILHLEQSIENPVLCTRKLANRLLCELPSKRLEMICSHFCIVNKRAHRAMSDVDVTVQVLENFLGILESRWISSKSEILNFQNSKIVR